MADGKLLYTQSAVRDVKALSSSVRKRLGKKLIFFASQDNPLQFAEPLTKPADAQYRFRIGDYRILFDVEDSNIVVLRVQHRREVYRK